MEQPVHSEWIYRGRNVSLRRDRVRCQDGRETVREVVVHPGAVAILPLLSSGEIVLISQFRYAVGRTLYEIPAGTLEPNETPLQCAARELEEETGLRAGKLTEMLEIVPSPGVMTETIRIFKATDLTETEARPRPDERLERQPVPIRRALEMVTEGLIVDAKTIVALLYLAQFGGRKTLQEADVGW